MTMKGFLLILLCVIGNFCFTAGYRTSELYHALNITCYGEDELNKICTSTAAAPKVAQYIRHDGFQQFNAFPFLFLLD